MRGCRTGFFVRMPPTPVTAPHLVRLNHKLARNLGLEPRGVEFNGGVGVPLRKPGPSRRPPLAMAYAGHQFGGWVPQLGDGRAILLGEMIDRDGVRLDILLKGAGRTPFSRTGDGRAGLGPVLREYIVSEAMAALGVPTTRALARGDDRRSCLAGASFARCDLDSGCAEPCPSGNVRVLRLAW